MDRIKKQINWGDSFRLGVTGKGVGVAVLDTGVCLHADLDGRVAAFCDVVRGEASRMMIIPTGPMCAESSEETGRHQTDVSRGWRRNAV